MEETVNAVVTNPARKRTKQKAVCCPIVYGSIAFSLGKGSDEFATHKWTLFVRGANGEDLSYFVEKIVFKLHPSFAQPSRELTAHPFEVTEKGWGEFEAAIRIHFKDQTEKYVEMTHVVKLYDGVSPQVSRPVLSEVYDEVVFTEPYEDFYGTLTDASKRPKIAAHPLAEHFGTFNDSKDLEVLVKVSDYIRGQLDAVKASVARLDNQISTCRQIEQSRAQQAAAQAAQAQQQKLQQQQQQLPQQQQQQQQGGANMKTATATPSSQQYQQPPKSVPAATAAHQKQHAAAVSSSASVHHTPNPAAQAAIQHQQHFQKSNKSTLVLLST